MPGDQRCRRFASEAELAGLWEVLFVFFFCRAKMVGKEKVYPRKVVFFQGIFNMIPLWGVQEPKKIATNS